MMSNYCEDDNAGHDTFVDFSKTNTKRKLNFDSVEKEQNEVDMVTDTKRLKLNNEYPTPVKKSVNEFADKNIGDLTGAVKRNFKTFTGELLTKNMISINNETFYLFKFLTENLSKEYYGNAGQYQGMRVNNVYEITLDYRNKKICIGSYKECKNKDNAVRVQRQLCCNNFESGDTVSVYARLKCGFNLLDNDNYKIVLHLLIADDDATNVTPKEIECTANLKKFTTAITDCAICTSNDLLAYFNKNEDKILKLQRVKCNQTNAALKSLILLPITQIVVDTKATLSFEPFDDAQNVSRVNKQIMKGQVATLEAEVVSTQNNERVVMSFNVKNNDAEDKVIKATYFVNSYNNNGGGGGQNKSLQYMETNLNQLNELIENDLAHVYIYVTHDSKNNYNVLGITKHEIDSDTYESL
ncbi:late expression factor 3 [Orgyia leucostigma nucleopolyhedrovirus]|uniref:Late expression factor 3 n=1 Tax=Orgyia leucostigma nucleopolyhedrovirus TaxID=490711 RepID=B0FDT3_9ABAC|nr:late expression factor 3 [Orgyia leucostigma nucleopolyhedrovirus]ABY65791.1 late expression factor 3 [Orgyia leucostigma nucleopolyhedrovirus]